MSLLAVGAGGGGALKAAKPSLLLEAVDDEGGEPKSAKKAPLEAGAGAGAGAAGAEAKFPQSAPALLLLLAVLFAAQSPPNASNEPFDCFVCAGSPKSSRFAAVTITTTISK